jgi:hypothetical protein
VGKSLQRHYQPCRLEHSPATVTFVLTTYLTYSQLRLASLSRSADPIHAHCPMPMLKASQGPGARGQGPRPTCSEHAIFATARRRLNTSTLTPCFSDSTPIQHRSCACGLLQVRNKNRTDQSRTEHLQLRVLLEILVVLYSQPSPSQACMHWASTLRTSPPITIYIIMLYIPTQHVGSSSVQYTKKKACLTEAVFLPTQ